MVQPAAVEAAIQRAIPDATVTVEDLTGGGDHLQVRWSPQLLLVCPESSSISWSTGHSLNGR